jgi:prepilin-type N-terminal cleavage/methylation domain-containing protein
MADFTVIVTRGQVGPQQCGFTLVEISLTLIIIAILIGGILKGWELVQNSRVRTIASTTTSIQSAYFAFYDRYGRVAGDWNAVAAGNAVGQTVNGGGNDSGHLDTTPGDPWTESNAFWEQLAKAGFINGTYQGTPGTEPTQANNLAPLKLRRRRPPTPAHRRRPRHTGGPVARAGHQAGRWQAGSGHRAGDRG